MANDPYRILGVKRTASTDDIKASYRKLARELHPDRRPGDKGAEDRFKAVSAAYTLLSDPALRKRFDAGEVDGDGNPKRGFRGFGAGFGGGFSRAAGARGADAYKRGQETKDDTKGDPAGTGAKSAGGFNGFFKDRKTRERAAIKTKGADVSYTLKVPFFEAARGADRTVRMTTGKTLRVRIPPGCENGQILRLRGQGMEGLGGGAAGDALVEILVEANAKFRVEGLDVHSEEAVTLPEAVQGARIEVETIHGPVRVTVPENSNTGTRLRLKGKGAQRPNAEAGDHYVTLKIVLPAGEDPELKAFVKKWAAKRPYTVRKASPAKTAAE
ncbi:MAG: J domain-containing protein [Alphaproteobacteria bacterium]|nr:J domain-containing protein [Alphaproteobacteria bacterium]